MPIYLCKVIDKSEMVREFVRDATSEEEIVRELIINGFNPIAITKIDKERFKLQKKKRISKNELIEFIDSVNLLLSSGLNIKSTLEIIQTIHLKGPINRITVHLLEEIKKGSSIHEAFEKAGGNIPTILKSFVKIGEQVGSLGESFGYLSNYLKKEKQMRNKIINSLIYPAFVLGVALIGIIVISAFILPGMKDVFISMGTGIPSGFKTTIKVADIVFFISLLISAILGISFIIIHFFIKKVGIIAETIDLFFLKLPVFGKMKSFRENLNLIFAMDLLVKSGYNIEDALFETESLISSIALRKAISRVRNRIIKGGSLSVAFLEESIFSDKIGKWIAIGEKTGSIKEGLSQLSNYFQKEMENWTLRILNIIEPAIILIIGIIVFLIILFFIMPIFSLYQSIF